MNKKNSKKKTVQKKETSNDDLSKQIGSLLAHIKAIDERIDVNDRKLSDQIEAVAFAVANIQNTLAEMRHKVNGINNRMDDFALNRAKIDEVNARFLKLEEKSGLFAGLVDTVQIDIMDGIFVPEKTWPYRGSVKEFGSRLANL